MKKVIVVTGVLFVMLLGCYCRRCYGESLSLWNNDTVIDATEAAEFRRAFYDICNYSLEEASNILFKIATGANIPTGTTTVTINNAQRTRWFDTTDNASFINQAYWRSGLLSINARRPPRDIVAESFTAQAPTRINNETRRTRLLKRMEFLTTPESE